MCATPLAGLSLSSCTSCDTLHHADCWDFFGGCSTYACGGRLQSAQRVEVFSRGPVLEITSSGKVERGPEVVGVSGETVGELWGRWVLDVHTAEERQLQVLAIGFLVAGNLSSPTPARLYGFMALAALAAVAYWMRHDRYEIDEVTSDLEFVSRSLGYESRSLAVRAADVTKVGRQCRVGHDGPRFRVVVETRSGNRFRISDWSEEAYGAFRLAHSLGERLGVPVVDSSPYGGGLTCGVIHYEPRSFTSRRVCGIFESLAVVPHRGVWLLGFGVLAWVVAYLRLVA